jgi:hypothetical protein
MFETYKAIKFKPEQFKDFLLSEEVGFVEYQEMGVPQAKTKGFIFTAIARRMPSP